MAVYLAGLPEKERVVTHVTGVRAWDIFGPRSYRKYADPDTMASGPEVYLVEALVPAWHLRPHYHSVDQFQLVTHGSGSLGKHRLEPVHRTTPMPIRRTVRLPATIPVLRISPFARGRPTRRASCRSRRSAASASHRATCSCRSISTCPQRRRYFRAATVWKPCGRWLHPGTHSSRHPPPAVAARSESSWRESSSAANSAIRAGRPTLPGSGGETPIGILAGAEGVEMLRLRFRANA